MKRSMVAFLTQLLLAIRSRFMRQAVPEGADAYPMRVVIHDWNDEDALRILRKLPPCDSDSREVAHDRIGPEAAQRVGSGKV